MCVCPPPPPTHTPVVHLHTYTHAVLTFLQKKHTHNASTACTGTTHRDSSSTAGRDAIDESFDFDTFATGFYALKHHSTQVSSRDSSPGTSPLPPGAQPPMFRRLVSVYKVTIEEGATCCVYMCPTSPAIGGWYMRYKTYSKCDMISCVCSCR